MAFTIATVTLDNGARIGVSPLPGRGGALDADIADIATWGADAVVSMTEWHEIEHVGATDAPTRYKDAGIAWFHVPIRDFGGPQGQSAEIWPVLSAQLHKILDAGGAVLTHCYGGHGRSGMVAMRLMVERGETPEEALARIRAVRPGAVEAPEQVRWASAGSSRGVSGGW